ncbi:hypothetical protein JCM5353_007271 [Sporobolomyces roseus]
MVEHSNQEAFRFGRLRFIRLPPTSISLALDKGRIESPAFDIGIGVTDDYGTDIDLFESIDLRLELVSSSTEGERADLGVKVASQERSEATNSIDFTFTPSRGPFHNLSIKLVSITAKPPPSGTISFRLSAVSPGNAIDLDEGTESQRIRSILEEPNQPVLETWDDKRYIFLSVDSGLVEWDKRPQGSISKDKVQTALRQVHLNSMLDPIAVVERPGLNNSTGSRLWDCAIGLSAYFSLYPDSLDASSPLPLLATTEYDGDAHRKKRRRTTTASNQNRVVELGAGCALASLAARRLTQSRLEEVSIVATDIEATVGTTLAENVSHNSQESSDKPIETAILEWGKLSDNRVKEILGSMPSLNLTLIATDVLYDPDTHPLLLDTLLSFLRPSDEIESSLGSARALIAYKRRTEGDDGFFELARKAGLEVAKVWEWSEVSVWSFT